MQSLINKLENSLNFGYTLEQSLLMNSDDKIYNLLAELEAEDVYFPKHWKGPCFNTATFFFALLSGEEKDYMFKANPFFNIESDKYKTFEPITKIKEYDSQEVITLHVKDNSFGHVYILLIYNNEVCILQSFQGAYTFDFENVSILDIDAYLEDLKTIEGRTKLYGLVEDDLNNLSKYESTKDDASDIFITAIKEDSLTETTERIDQFKNKYLLGLSRALFIWSKYIQVRNDDKEYLEIIQEALIDISRVLSNLSDETIEEYGHKRLLEMIGDFHEENDSRISEYFDQLKEKK